MTTPHEYDCMRLALSRAVRARVLELRRAGATRDGAKRTILAQLDRHAPADDDDWRYLRRRILQAVDDG